jgi:signal transduction histidine kinase/ActR/RegA family two-component response regulator
MKPQRRPVILVVDDEHDFRTSLADILGSRGYECVVAGTVEEGALQARERRPDLCLIDLKLPDGSGLDLLTRIKELSPHAESVVLTGFASLPSAIKALNLGAFSYLEKPYSVDRLFLTLERALERQRLIQAVRRSESAYDQLLSATGAAIFSLDPTTWVVGNVNHAFTRLLGHSAERNGDTTRRSQMADQRTQNGRDGSEISNLTSDFAQTSVLNLDQLLPITERDPIKQALSQLSKAQPGQTQNLTLDAPLLCKDGTTRWFSINATRIPRTLSADPHRSPVPQGVKPCLDFDLLLICNDISAGRDALTELERTKDFIEGVFSALPCGVVIVDSEYQVIDSNPAYGRPLDLTRDGLRGRRCYEVFNNYRSPCSMFGELCPITAARTTGTIGRVHREHGLPGGRIRNIEYTANPLLDRHGNIGSFVLVISDLTDLREAGDRLQQAKTQLETLNAELRHHHEELKANAKRLERANVELLKLSNAKSEFVATVSHELRTPLTAIAEAVGLVEDGSLGTVNKEQLTFLRLAGQNTRRLADLINDLLDLSRIEAGKLELTPRRLDLARLIRDTSVTYSAVAKEKGLTLNVELPASTPPVLADQQSVERVLVNLVGNAIKFTPSGGTITIGVGNTAEITAFVQDTGVGIPKDQQYRLFGKFEQIARPGEVRPKGTGLGLALSQQLLEMNHGRIWVESEEGRGAKFLFALPAYSEPAHFRALYRQFAASVDGGRADVTGGPAHPALYLLKVVSLSVPDPMGTPNFALRPSPSALRPLPGACAVVLSQLRELLESAFTRPDAVLTLESESAAVIFAPRRMPDERFRVLLDSLKGASFFVQDQEVKMRLRCGVLDYRPELFREHDPNRRDSESCPLTVQPRLNAGSRSGEGTPLRGVSPFCPEIEFGELYRVMEPLLEDVK